MEGCKWWARVLPRRCDGELRCLLFRTFVGARDVFACAIVYWCEVRETVCSWRGLYYRVV